MGINDWPVGERPRERMLERGCIALSDAELVAVLLGTGRRGLSAVDLARELLGTHGGLRGLLGLPVQALTRHPGVGPSRACTLSAAAELGRRQLAQDVQRSDPLGSPAQTRAFLRASLRDLPYEVFVAMFLDSRHRVIATEELFRGGIDGASVHPREVVRRCLVHNAAALIIAHNHPSGVSEPSAADHALTRRLRDTLALIDVRLLDHFVVGEHEPLSFAERGWI